MCLPVYRVMTIAVILAVVSGFSPVRMMFPAANAQSSVQTNTETGSSPTAAIDAENMICLRLDDLHIDPGYCAGLSMAYMETLGDNEALAMVKQTRAIEDLRGIQKICHTTRFDSAFGLGQAAFHRMLYYASPDRLNTRLMQCFEMLNYYRLSWPDNGGRGKD